MDMWHHRQESNLYLALRRRSFYPLNYGGKGLEQKSSTHYAAAFGKPHFKRWRIDGLLEALHIAPLLQEKAASYPARPAPSVITHGVDQIQRALLAGLGAQFQLAAQVEEEVELRDRKSVV